MSSYLYRNRLGFWLLGLCNNYAYVIMLSAAEALIEKTHYGSDSDATVICNPISTGTILLADIIPSLITKSLSPFINVSTRIRVVCAILLTVLAFLLTSFSNGHLMTYTGVICASISSGLGEVTFLAFAAEFERGVVSLWSSGTGMAGLAGAGLYTLVTSLVSVESCLLIMIIVPVIEALTFGILISKPENSPSRQALLVSDEEEYDHADDIQQEDSSSIHLTIREKIAIADTNFIMFRTPSYSLIKS